MSVRVLYHLLRERLYWRLPPRVPEPDLVMQAVEQATSFSQAGTDDGVLNFLYLYHAVQITSVLRAGDRVLDLACGPANQLIQIAQLNPLAHFVGLDASPAMLECARSALVRSALRNVELVQGDMLHLSMLDDASMDCVVCTMSLHHLPDQAALSATLREVRRVLKPDGRLYLTDFGRLKLTSTQRFLANDMRQSPQFTLDYYNSLRAAFSVRELSLAAAQLGPDLQRHVMVLAPFIVVIRSRFQRPIDPQAQARAKKEFAKLSAAQQDNFRSTANWFALSGYALACKLD